MPVAAAQGWARGTGAALFDPCDRCSRLSSICSRAGAKIRIAVARALSFFRGRRRPPGRKLWGQAVAGAVAARRARPRLRRFRDFGRPAPQASPPAAADALAIHPQPRAVSSDPGRFSAPMHRPSRSFLNILFGDPALIGAPVAASPAVGALIDWTTCGPERLAVLRAAFAQCGDEVRGRPWPPTVPKPARRWSSMRCSTRCTPISSPRARPGWQELAG